MSDRIVVAREGEIAPGGCRVVTVNQREVAVFHVDGQYFAIDDRCPHAGASLSGGHVENGIVTCPWHYWRFRLCDGAWADNPRIRTRSYPIVVEQGEICLVTDSPPPN